MSGAEEDLTLGQIQDRAVSGTLAVAIRGVVVRALGFAASVVLARLLSPHEFGLAAVGLTVVAFGAFVSDGGIGAAYVRRTEEPTSRELGLVLGLQLAMTGALVLVALAVAPLLGELGWVTAVMVASLPLQCLQTAGAISLERRLEFGRRVQVEVTEIMAYVVWAVGSVALGAGVWGLASASLVRGVAGAVAMNLVVPGARVRPVWQLHEGRAALAFGAKVQSISLVNLARDEGLNIAVAAIGGVAQLGLWNMAYRAMQVPYLLFESLWRVTFPVMSRLVGGEHDALPAVRRILRTGSALTGMVLVALAGAGPHLLGALLGPTWDEGSKVVAPAALGLMVSGPISVASAGFLFAAGDTRVLLRASVLHTLVWFAVALPLLDDLGVAALGWGWLGCSVVDAVILGRALHTRAGVSPFRLVLPTSGVAVVSTACGYLSVEAEGGSGMVGVVLGAAVAESVYLVLLPLVQRGALAEVLRLLGETVRQRRSR